MRIRLLPRSLAAQLTILLLAAVLVAQTLTTLIFAESRRSAIDAAAREQVLGRTATLVRLIEETPPEQHEHILAASSSNRLHYSIDDAPVVSGAPDQNADTFEQNRLSDVFGGGRQVRAEFFDRHRSDLEDTPDGARPHAGARRIGQPTVALSVQLSNGKWLNSETLLPRPVLWAWPTLVSTLFMAIAVVLIVGLSLRRITQPLRRLAEASDRLGRGETVDALPEAGPEEVARASHAFNAMQERVKRFVADRTRMLAAVSHDLRTPLTALRLRAEFIDDDEIREKITDAVDEMTRMTEATLAFAREDAAHEETHDTNIGALVQAVADDFTELGHDVTMSGPERLDHPVRQVALRRALRNLVENAIRYGERARVAYARGGRDLVITVDDDGPGIPPDRIEDVFAPFTRLESSRNQETGGVGLGLATARSIVRAHGGELTLANRSGGGLTATIRLPGANR
ncbi:ATP-binding protein [Oryzibacter oryziterrae]|uniref:ATP-binding protein n=1 Tax=Oryzibacter oryziterrae TaxID=2766474 RepID=UPI001F1D55B7|nr:ATP-binding protein [Oryzibacter oryziterrae]